MVPDCENGSGCLVPPLLPQAARALEIRDKLLRLAKLNIGSGILAIYAATSDDLELLAVAEDISREEHQADPEEDHGD